jgi:hypothetical protein
MKLYLALHSVEYVGLHVLFFVCLRFVKNLLILSFHGDALSVLNRVEGGFLPTFQSAILPLSLGLKCGIQMFINLFTRARSWTLSRAR